MAEAKCSICLETIPSRYSILLTNPCGHFLCQNCAKELTIRWRNRTSRRKCPNCRDLLDGFNSIIKPHSYSICNNVNASLFFWIPKNLAFKEGSAYQNLIKYLEVKSFQHAFKLSFLLNIQPDEHQELIAPGWKARYRTMVENLFCVLCNTHISLDDCFVSKCGHFYCTVCASYTLYSKAMKLSYRYTPCTECGQILKDHDLDYGLIRPMGVEGNVVE